MLDRVAHDLLERETLDGEEVYNTIRTMTGRDHAPTRPVPPGEGLVIGGHEVPEAVVTPAARANAAEAPDVQEEVDAEIAGAQRRSVQPVPEPKQSA